MREIKLLIEKLKINYEREFEREVKFLLEMKKCNDNINYGGNKSDEESSLNSFNNAIAYVQKIYKEITKKCIYDTSYYGTVVNTHKKSSYYNSLMNFGISDKNEDLINFYYMYLIRKYCEKSFYLCLHSQYVRSITYSYLERKTFDRYIDSDLYFLFSYMRAFSYVLLKNNNLNLYLIHLCINLLSKTYEELNRIRTISKNEKTKLYDETKYVPHNSLIKYVYFIIEYLGKNKNYSYLDMIYGIYPCFHVFFNVYKTCSLVFNNDKSQKIVDNKKDNNHQDNKISENRESYPVDDKNNFHLYYKYINEYSCNESMEINDLLLYYISKEKLNTDLTFNDIVRGLNILNYSTILEKLFFMEVFVNYENELSDNEKFKFIKMNIFKKICNHYDSCPLYFEFPTEQRILCNNYDEEKKKKTNTHNTSDQTDCINDTKNITNDLVKKINNYEFHHTFFGKAQFIINDLFFKEFFNDTTKEGSQKNQNKETNITDILKDNEDNLNIEKNRFLKTFNDNFIEKKYYLELINEFYYIGLDFDKTISKRDTYIVLFKMLRKYYNYNEDIKTELTQNDIDMFDSMSFEKLKEKKKVYSPKERMDYLLKLDEWFLLRRDTILKKLKEKSDISEVYSDSYYYFLNLFDDLNTKVSISISYCDILKDVDIDIYGNLIDKFIEEFEIHDYFIDFFLNLLNYKQNNSQTFYFDIITLNFKKELIISIIKNIFMNIDNLCYGKSLDYFNNKNYKKLNQCSDTSKANDYYTSIEKYFNIYYSKTYSYDIENKKYTGDYAFDQLDIKYNNYSQENKIDKVNLISIYDKTLIKNKVCSLLKRLNNKLTCYIGDSVFDIDVLLSVDIPILMGKDRFVTEFCKKHNILIKPLILASAKIEYIKLKNKKDNKSNANMSESLSSLKKMRGEELADVYDEHKRIIYCTESWLEIGVFFFGNF